MCAVLTHAVSNLFNGVIMQLLRDNFVIALGIYALMIMALGVTGLILFFINRKKVVLDDTPGLIDKQALKDVFTNKGIVFYTALTVITIVLKAVLK